jgi:REP element-mobilizing transposase RayT
MRFKRLTVDSLKELAYYHLINRIAGGDWLLGDEEKEILRRQLWATAAYCGVTVVTYALMSNHYHLLVLVPQRRDVSDKELLDRYREFHPRQTRQQAKKMKEIEDGLLINGPKGQAWRKRQLRQMFDLSRFGALVDQRFSIWYNRSHDRKGTLWMGRFKSVLVEDGDALREMAMYIDMNACRAGIVTDPIDYRFCGYAEAVAGASHARKGLQHVFSTSWDETSQRYRAHLLVMMRANVAEHSQCAPTEESVQAAASHLSIGVRLNCRIRYFVEGMALGSAAFVREKAALLPGERKRPPKPLEERGLCAGLNIVGRLLRTESRPS